MDLNKLLNKKEFLKFDNIMRKFIGTMSAQNYSYVGFNYLEKKIKSVKFYYVFFDLPVNNFPVRELKEIFQKYVENISASHLSTPFLPGSGLTVTIKFDSEMNITKGVFFRVNLENQILKKNVIKSFSKYNFTDDDFEDGYGQYLLIKNGKITTNEYLYLKNGQKIEAFGEKIGIHFLESNAVEISSAASKDCCDSKFIAIGGSNLIHKRFRNMIPQKITNVFNSDELQYCCPAIHTFEEMYSVYVFGKKFLHQDSTNPIDYFIKKMTL